MRRLPFLALAGLTLMVGSSTFAEDEEQEPKAPVVTAPEAALPAAPDVQTPSVEELRAEIEALRRQVQEAPALAEKLAELEQKVQLLEQHAKAQEAEEAKLEQEKKQRAIAYYRDGFFIETPDGKFRLQLAGVLHFDTRIFGGGEESSPTSFDIRRGRYDFRGWFYKGDLEQAFRLQIEMADSPYLRNAYWMFKFHPAFNLQLGQFKAPAGGADWLTEEAQVNFVEYSIQTPVTPFFDRGFNIHSFLVGGRIQTNLGVVTGAGADVEVQSGDTDDHKDFVARLLLVPFKDREESSLKGLHLAGSFQQGLASVRARQGGEGGYRTESYQSRWFDWKAGTVEVERRRRYGLDMHYIRGPVTVSGELARLEWKNVTSFTNGIASLDGTASADVAQVWVSWFPTGEQKTFEDVFFAWRQPKPKKTFSPKSRTWGGFEVMARYSYHRTSPELFEIGLLDGSREGYAFTAGLRWLWNPKVRIMLDWNYLKSTEGAGIVVDRVQNGVFPTKGYVDHETALLLRFILSI
jgi:phosphate-selective porin